MTDEEQIFHCAAILSAAHHLGIGIQESSKDGKFAFDFRDGLSGLVVYGPSDSVRKKALELACDKLADFLAMPPHHHEPISSRYKI